MQNPKTCNPKHPGNPGHNVNLRITGIEESKDLQFKGSVNIFNKITVENFPNLKKKMPMNIQEVYRTPNRLDENRNSSHHIKIKTLNALNKEY